MVKDLVFVLVLLWILLTHLRLVTWRRRARLAACAFFMRSALPGDYLKAVTRLPWKWPEADPQAVPVLGESDLARCGAVGLFDEWEPRFWAAIKQRNQ